MEWLTVLMQFMRSHGEAKDAQGKVAFSAGLQNVWAESFSAPEKNEFDVLLEWGVRISYSFHENQTPRSDSANFVPLEAY